MPVIKRSSSTLILINTFEVEPDKADILLNFLIDVTEKTMRHVDGFISASFHKSIDGKYIANYAQWENEQAFQAMLKNDEATKHIEQAKELCISFSPVTYQVVHTEEK